MPAVGSDRTPDHGPWRAPWRPAPVLPAGLRLPGIGEWAPPWQARPCMRRMIAFGPMRPAAATAPGRASTPLPGRRHPMARSGCSTPRSATEASVTRVHPGRSGADPAPSRNRAPPRLATGDGEERRAMVKTAPCQAGGRSGRLRCDPGTGRPLAQPQARPWPQPRLIRGRSLPPSGPEPCARPPVAGRAPRPMPRPPPPWGRPRPRARDRAARSPGPRRSRYSSRRPWPGPASCAACR